MRLKEVAGAIAIAGALALLVVPANAASKKKRAAVEARDQTVFVSRDENGRKRTRIIIQKRSYLDPGTETFPGERGDNGYAQLPNQRASSVIDNTIFGLTNTQSPLPGPWTLPGKNNPWLQD